MTWPASAAQHTAPGPGRRRVIAVDGKTLRGSGHDGDDGRRLPAAFDHARGVVVGQVEAGAKTSEIPLFTALLDRLDIADAVITADALQAQRDHATYLARRGACYLLIVKRNQPSLHAQLALPWRDVPVAYDKRERGHGRTERRILKLTSVAGGLAFPHAVQATQIVRRRKLEGRWSRETSYAVTSLTTTQASHTQLAAIIRGHRGIEDRPHWVRDLDWDEDRSQVRTASGPDHGQPAQPGHHHRAAVRSRQHRRRPALPRTAARPATPDDHDALTTSGAAAME
jgi:predicted transposase YbfD/YdcC